MCYKIYLRSSSKPTTDSKKKKRKSEKEIHKFEYRENKKSTKVILK